jgi:hypothetical protein
MIAPLFYQHHGLSTPVIGISFVASMETEQLQELHYDRIATEYEFQYSDLGSRRYGERFIHERMFAGIELSMVFRIPVRLKPLYTPIVMVGESFINKFLGKSLSCFVVCQWRKI